MDGLILVDKPSGWTSHDVVGKIRKLLGERRVGHFGTLDPLATGLLLVAVGKATRLFPFFSRADKSYRGRIRLGYATDTHDAQGQPVTAESHDFPDEMKLRSAMSRYGGSILQTPPLYSAKKIQGQPGYKLARRQKEVSLKPERVTIHAFLLENYSPPFIDFRTECSSGTYIRSLAHDLGRSLGCGAHLDSLCRLSSGEYSLEQAFRLEEIESLIFLGKYDDFLLPLEFLLPAFTKLILADSGFRRVKNGRPITPQDIAPAQAWPELSSSVPKTPVFRLFSPEGRLIALARLEADSRSLHPFLVLG